MHEKLSSADSIQRLLNRVRSLAHRSAREKERCFWIEGIRHFVQASDAHFPFDTVLYSPILLKSDLAEMLTRRLKATGVPRVRLTPEQFRSVSLGDRASGVGAIVRQRWVPLAQLSPQHGLCILVIEYLRSAGNLGTILRTAEACGVGGIIFVGPATDPFDPAVVRASMGGLFHLPLVRANHDQVRSWARTHGVSVVGLAPGTAHLWTDLPASGLIAVALGEERQGLSPRLQGLCERMVRLPMCGRADSLNVGVAAGVMMYELVRRQHVARTG